MAKAFGAGADFVMLGGMLAGHDECLGEVINLLIFLVLHRSIFFIVHFVY